MKEEIFEKIFTTLGLVVLISLGLIAVLFPIVVILEIIEKLQVIM